MFRKTWSIETDQGRKNRAALLALVKRIGYKAELGPLTEKDPQLKRMRYFSIYQQLRREVQEKSDIGKAWKKIPNRPNILHRLFPNKVVHPRLAEVLRTQSLNAAEAEFPALIGLSSSQMRDLRQLLKVRSPASGTAARVGKKEKPVPAARTTPVTGRSWWSSLSEDQQRAFGSELLEDWRKDCRLAGNSNADLVAKWKEKTRYPFETEDGLRHAVRTLGETRNRMQIANEIQTREAVDKTIDARLLELIHANALNTLGMARILEKIRREFAEGLEKTGLTMSEDRLKIKVSNILWQDGPNTPLAELREIVKYNRSLKKFIAYHSYIPQEMIEAKEREIKGITNDIDREKVKALASTTIPGILRFAGKEGLKGGEDFEFPRINFRRPFEVPCANPNRWKVVFINGANIGIPYNRDMEQNPTRQAFALAKHLRVDAVFVENTLDLVTTKAQGPRRALEARFSGREINLDIMDPLYREEAARILDEISSGNPELVYEIASEALRNLMTGWRKITRHPKYKDRPDNKETAPEYNGKVFVVFGHKEEAIVAAIAYGEALYETLVKQNEERAEHRMVLLAIRRNEKQISAYRKQMTELEEERREHPETAQEISQHIAEIVASIERLIQENAVFEARASELRASFEVRFRVSNIAPELWNLYMRKAFAFMVSLFEDAELGIPNCKVISNGSTYVKLGEQIIEISIPGHLQVTDTLLSDYCSVYGPRVLRKEMADFVVICHPYALRYELTAREKDAGGVRASAQVCTAPICVDGKFVRSKLADTVAKVHPIGRAVFNELFNPGVLVLSSINHVIVPDHYSIEALAHHEKNVPVVLVKKPKVPLAGKYIWEKFATDQHWGGQSQATVDCGHCGTKFDMGTAIFHAMRIAGFGNGENGTKLPPIHGYTANDDPTQGHHFDAEHMPHPHQLLYPDIERLMQEKLAQMQEARRSAEKQEFARWIMRFGLHQLRIRGVYFMTDQISLVLKSQIQPNIDLFDGILRRGVTSRLIVKGVSAFNEDSVVVGDTRDIGIINWGTGNHCIKTTEGTFSEGPSYAANMQEMLLQQPFWQERVDCVRKLVRAPLYGREFIAWGTMQAPDGYEWGCDYRNTPPGGVNWGAPLKATARNDLRRANYSRIFEGKVTKKTCGDKHFLTHLLAAHAVYLMGPAGAHTDGYGELGFPPNNSGIVFWGTPAEGPAAGPILLRPLLYDHIKRLMKDPRNFDWDSFLPNPL